VIQITAERNFAVVVNRDGPIFPGQPERDASDRVLQHEDRAGYEISLATPKLRDRSARASDRRNWSALARWGLGNRPTGNFFRDFRTYRIQITIQKAAGGRSFLVTVEMPLLTNGRQRNGETATE
jgi:hypothetical protein